MSYEVIRRTAPATPGLLKISWLKFLFSSCTSVRVKQIFEPNIHASKISNLNVFPIGVFYLNVEEKLLFIWNIFKDGMYGR